MSRRPTRPLRRLGHALTGEEPAGVLGVVAFGWLAIFGTRFVVPVLLPAVRETFGIDNATAGTAVTVVWAGYALTQFPAGAVVDRVGERRTLSVSLVAAAAGIAVVAGAPTVALFVLGCGAFGVGSGLFGPARATVLSRVYAENEGVAFGVVLSAGSLGAAVLPFVANRLVARLGWRGALGGAVPVLVLAAAGTVLVVPERSSPVSSSLPDRDDLRAVARTVRRRRIGLAAGAMALMLFAFQGLSAFLPTYLVVVKGLNSAVAGVLYALLFAGGTVFRWIAGAAADRVGHGPVLVAVAASSVVPLVALPFVGDVFPLAVVCVALGARLGAEPVTNAYVVGELDPVVRGTAWGLLRTLLFLVGSAGSVAVGLIADRALFDAAFLGLAGVTAVATVLYLAVPSVDR